MDRLERFEKVLNDIIDEYKDLEKNFNNLHYCKKDVK